MPATYVVYADRYLKSMQEYPTSHIANAADVEQVYAAATGNDDKLRYPVSAVSVLLPELRQSVFEQSFIARSRTMSGLIAGSLVSRKE